jgi:hypothetical protein
MLRNILLTVTTCFVLTLAVSGQDVEYGNATDLKGLTTYYVDTRGDLKAHDKIVAEIAKELPDLKLEDDLDGADIKLVYEGGSDQELRSYNTSTTNHPAVQSRTENLPTGAGMVAVAPHGSDKSKPRIVLSFHSRQDGRLEKMPYTKFAREFIKVYKSGNGMK